jgi:WD40 repeat protein
MLWVTPGASSAESKTIVSVCCSSDQKTIATLLYDGTVKLWDFTSRHELFAVPSPTNVQERQWIGFADSATLLLGTESESKIFSLNAAELPFARHKSGVD